MGLGVRIQVRRKAIFGSGGRSTASPVASGVASPGAGIAFVCWKLRRREMSAIEDTIAAISTPVGEGGIGIVRVSGAGALAIAARVFRPRRAKDISSVRTFSAHVGQVVDPKNGSAIDEAILTVMRRPGSYTREDVCELSCHGGLVAVRRVLEAVIRAGARLAEPGEFTKRAFLNGRIDLAQAEAVIDLIRAKTDRAMEVAAGQLGGRLSRAVSELREHLIGCLAEIEAGLDFPEEDIEDVSRERLRGEIDSTGARVEKILAGAGAGRILREGLRTVIAGRPNVGKSSLLNALLDARRAIVTDVPGTTRDAIEEVASIRGIPVVLVDTAGIRETLDLVERLGVDRAKELLREADLALLVVDDSAGVTGEDLRIMELVAGRPVMLVANKADLGLGRAEPGEARRILGEVPFLRVSAVTGEGLDDLAAAIEGLVYGGRANPGEVPLAANVRHKAALEKARAALAAASSALRAGTPLDFLAIDLKGALEALGEITGETVGEDIIDEIFRRFCIGK